MNEKNLDKLITEALAIETEEAKEAGVLGFMARALVQATLPHKKQKNNEFKRKNGSFKFVILADSDIGLPYGSIPRLLMAWISTEAVKTKSRELVLGDSLSQFMRKLDLVPTGGRWGTITRLREQMQRLFSSYISCSYNDGEHWAIKNLSPVEEAHLWWQPKNPDQAALFKSTLVLGDKFFKEIINYPIPIDMRALKALKKSPMAIDIYCWLTYRMSYLKKLTQIPWQSLQAQFGANYPLTAQGTRDFKKSFLRQLKKVYVLYDGLSVLKEEKGLTLRPSKTHIRSLK